MILDAFRLDGKVAIVTGASGGLGQGMALALAEAGADIVGVSSSPSTATGEKVEALGRRYLMLQADLRDASLAAAVVPQVVEAFGRVDVLVNNAGIIRRNDALDFTEQDWDDVMNLNLKTVFFLSQAAARVMMTQPEGGSIIHIASMLSFQGGVRVPSYCASKSGLAGITRAMANEWASANVRVNAIAPGYMATDNTHQLRDDADRSAEILARIPAARWGTPADMAGPVVFLASGAAAYVHGAILAADGGWLAR